MLLNGGLQLRKLQICNKTQVSVGEGVVISVRGGSRGGGVS